MPRGSKGACASLGEMTSLANVSSAPWNRRTSPLRGRLTFWLATRRLPLWSRMTPRGPFRASLGGDVKVLSKAPELASYCLIVLSGQSDWSPTYRESVEGTARGSSSSRSSRRRRGGGERRARRRSQEAPRCRSQERMRMAQSPSGRCFALREDVVVAGGGVVLLDDTQDVGVERPEAVDA